MLKKFVKDLKEVDEKYHDLYEEGDGGYVLQMEDDDSGGGGDDDSKRLKAKVDEFRSRNIELNNRLKELEKDLKKMPSEEDWKKAQKALERVNALEEEQLIEAGDLDKVVEKRTKSMKDELTKQIKLKEDALEGITKERDTLRGELGRLKIDTQVQSHINKVGIPRSGAMSDILNRARATFSLDDEGNVVALDSDGTPAYDTDTKPLTMERWSQDLIKDAPFLFESAEGGGSKGSRKGDSGGSKVISRDDPDAFAANLEDIAAGKVQVGAED